MARSTFGGTTADFVFSTYRFAGRQLLDLAPATLTFYDAETGGTQQTVYVDGNPTQSVTVGADGQIPEFEGPDGVSELWATAGGPRVKMLAPGVAVADDASIAAAIGTGGATDAKLDAAYAKKGEAGGNPVGEYVPIGWGENWRTKLTAAQAGTGKATLALVGDSLTQGQYASSVDTTAWAALLRSALQGTVGGPGDGGTGLDLFNRHTLYFPAATGGLWASSGTWAKYGPDNGPGATTIYSTVDGSTLTKTLRGQVITVYYLKNTTMGDFSVTVDGVNVSGTLNASGSAGMGTYVYDTGVEGEHTVVITKIGTTGVYMHGVSAENPTGVVVNNFGKPGAKSANMAAAGSVSPVLVNTAGPNYPADLVVYGLGVNDSNGTAVDPEAFIHNVRLTLDNFRAYNDGATDLLLWIPHVGKWEDSGTKYYGEYALRLRALAESYGAAVVNSWAKGRNSHPYMSTLSHWGNINVPGTAGSDNVHMSDIGNQRVYDELSPLILPA